MKILGIGNALVDISVKLPGEELLNDLHLAKGSMNHIDAGKREIVFEKIKRLTVRQTTGGSVSNTTLALKQLGEPVGYVGKIGNDSYGDFYLKEMTDLGVELHLIQENTFSGTAIALITPDGERTFCTYLGAAADMKKEDLRRSVLEQYTHLYVEGYLVQNHELMEAVLRMAKSLNMTVMLDLASYNVVASDKEFIRNLIEQYVDILFANEEEALALTGKAPEEATHDIAEKVQTVIIKEGAKGSWVKHQGMFMHVPVYKEINPLDTTAAGDYYAAGFFYGMINQAGPKKCAEVGTLLSYYIIQVIGTQLPEDTWKEIRTKVREILTK